MMPADKKYEEFAFVLDYSARGKSAVINGREGPMVQCLGEERLTLLELLAIENQSFEVGEKVKIGKEGREKIISVLGRLEYVELTPEARGSLPAVAETLVRMNERKFVAYFNDLQPLTPRLHGLELIPGIGKKFMKVILETREKRPFSSFEDIQERVGLREPAKMMARRIIEELAGDSRVTLFVKR